MHNKHHLHKSVIWNSNAITSYVIDSQTNKINIDKRKNHQTKTIIKIGKIILIAIPFVAALCTIIGINALSIWEYFTSKYNDNKKTEPISKDDASLNLVQSEKSYKEYLTNNIDINYLVTDFIYADFDFNGTYEMFAIADNESESTLYYVDTNGLSELDEWKCGYKSGSRLKILNLEQQSFIVLTDGARASGHKGDIWTVYNNAPCQIFSKNVYSVDKNEYNEIVIRETYSKLSSGGEVSGFGITMKPYYFYYSEGKLYEYGGKVMYRNKDSQPPKEFLDYPEAAEILKKIDDREFFVNDYLFRSNNTITLNLKIKDPKSLQTTSSWAEEYETYRIVDNSLVLEENGFGSNYLSPYCLVPEVAVF